MSAGVDILNSTVIDHNDALFATKQLQSHRHARLCRMRMYCAVIALDTSLFAANSFID